MKKKYFLLTEVHEDDFLIPEDAFYTETMFFDDCSPDNPYYEESKKHDVYLVFSGDRTTLLGVIDYEET